MTNPHDAVYYGANEMLVMVGNRYLFVTHHLDTDHDIWEASVEEISPSGHWVKLRHFPGGSYEWKHATELHVIEKLPPLEEKKSDSKV